MSRKTRLELTWIGKDERPRLEPRILVEEPSRSYHSATKRDGDLFDNMLIHGDNLLALKALEQRFSGAINCIYIDPPFNIDAATPHYEDGIEHSQWLSLMRERLFLLRNLLTDDGYIAVHIDDEEVAYLTVLMDEVFGRVSRVNIIAVKMSEASGVKMAHAEKRLPKLKEYILLYRKRNVSPLHIELTPIENWNDEYKTVLTGLTKETVQELKGLISKTSATENDIVSCNALLKPAKTVSLAELFRSENIAKGDQEKFKWENAWRIIQAVGSTSVFAMAKRQPLRDQDIAAGLSATGLVYLYKTDFDAAAKQPRVQVLFADDNLMRNPGDFWQDIKTTGAVGLEGGVLFPNGKKPEALLRRVIGMCSAPGDLVMDSFGGSGTTGAVAHKMRRRWIMIEAGDQCFTHIAPRLAKVIDGTDATGVSEAAKWKGGGGFRYYHLAPSLIETDRWGNRIISSKYNGAMLAEAMCKHLGFTYAPSTDPREYWNHGHSSERDFIYVTTASLTAAALRGIAEDAGPDRTLLICCKAFDAKASTFENLTIKKIPQAVLATCEWGRDDYSLCVSQLPEREEPEAAEEVILRRKARPKSSDESPSLFDGEV